MVKPRRLAPVLAVVFATLAGGACYAGQLKDIHDDDWTTSQMMGIKIGYSHSTLGPSKFRGKDVYLSEDLSVVSARVGSEKKSVSMSAKCYVGADLYPIFETGTIVQSDQSGDRPTQSTKTIEVTYGPKTIECRIEEGGKITSKSIRIPEGADLSAVWKYRFDDSKVKVGQTAEIWEFSATDLAISHVTHKVTAREKIEVNGKSHDAFVSVAKDESSEIKTWLTEDGDLIKREVIGMPVPLVELPSTWEEALNGMESDGPDFAELTAIKADKQIKYPDRVTQMRMRLVNPPFDADQIISDYRQTAKTLPNNGGVEYTIRAAAFDPAKSLSLPISGKGLAQYLAPSPGIEVADKAIRNLAGRIVGSEKNAFKAACKIRRWVVDNVVATEARGEQPDESALAVLGARKGVCRHKALLYTALARAVGIPTRLAVGLIYNDGQMQGHAWADSYVGEWVPVDPTREGDFVDAARIKHGESAKADILTRGFEPRVGAKAEIIDCAMDISALVRECSRGDEIAFTLDGAVISVPPGSEMPKGAIRCPVGCACLSKDGDSGVLCIPPGSKVPADSGAAALATLKANPCPWGYIALLFEKGEPLYWPLGSQLTPEAIVEACDKAFGSRPADLARNIAVVCANGEVLFWPYGLPMAQDSLDKACEAAEKRAADKAVR